MWTRTTRFAIDEAEKDRTPTRILAQRGFVWNRTAYSKDDIVMIEKWHADA